MSDRTPFPYWLTAVALVATCLAPAPSAAQSTCTYSINPASHSVGPWGSGGTIYVTTQEGCAWTAESHSSFLIFNPTAGSGSGTVGFSFTRNETTLTRIGTGTVAGQTFTLTQEGTIPCDQASLSPASVSISAAAYDAVISLSTGFTCGWTAVSNDPAVLLLRDTSGTGESLIGFHVYANTSSSPRTATATIAGRTFTVTQAGVPPPPPPDCAYAIEPSAIAVGYRGTSSTITVTTQPGCPWIVAAGTGGFIGFPGAMNGVGPGSVAYQVQTNTSRTPRVGTFTVAGLTVTVSQEAYPPCPLWIYPDMVQVSNISDTGAIRVNSLPGCEWTARSHVDWIQIVPDLGTGYNGSVAFTIQTNFSTEPRSGTVTVDDLTFTVNQAGLDVARRDRERARADFTGDGNNDLVWQETERGYLALWALDGSHTTKAALAIDVMLDDNDWHIVGTGDFNADGKPDLLWYNEVRDEAYVWNMDGGTRLSDHGYLSPRKFGWPNWRVAGVGDFNKDGKPDILWQHEIHGWLVVWLMDGRTRLQSVDLTPNRADPPWTVAAVADVDGDNDADLIWRNMSTGELKAWFMNAVTLALEHPVSPSLVDDLDWEIVSSADVNGDSAPDLVWHHRTQGWIAVWYMHGLGRVDYGVFPWAVETVWRIAGPK